MIRDAGGAPTPPQPQSRTPRVGFDIHVLQDVHHADQADLHRIGEAAYQAAGFRSEVSAAERAQIMAANPAAVLGEPNVRDMRQLCWSAIDNPSSKDPDQVSASERLPDGSIRLYVASADVDEVVAQKSPIDQRVMDNMTSIYTDLDTYNMLPTELCEDKTVFVPGQDRPAVVTEMTVTPDGEVKDKKMYRALVNSHAQLNYPQVDKWFAEHDGMPEVAGLPDQLKMQDEAAALLEAGENAAGRPPIHDHGTSNLPQSGQRLVEMQMRTVNRIAADYLLAHGSPALVKGRALTPDNWAKLTQLATERGSSLAAQPDAKALQTFVEAQHKIEHQHKADAEKAAQDGTPHEAPKHTPIDTALNNIIGGPKVVVAQPGKENEIFTQGAPLSARITGPNRLATDLVNQRLVKAVLKGQPSPYDAASLQQIADRANVIDARTHDVMATIAHSMAAFSMQEQIGKVFAGKVTGANNIGSFVRLDGVKSDGFVRDQQLPKGEAVSVRVDSVDIEKGRIKMTVVNTPPSPSQS